MKENNEKDEKRAITLTYSLSERHSKSKINRFSTTILKNQIQDIDLAKKATNKYIQELITALKLIKWVKCLNLAYNNINLTNLKSMSTMLEINSSLSKLSLAGNNIGDHGLEQLSYGLKMNFGLNELNLEKNNLTTFGLNNFSINVLKTNKTITKLSLAKNKIDNLTVIAQNLIGNTSLISLNLSNNILTFENIFNFFKILKNDTSILHLNFLNKIMNFNDEGNNLSNYIKLISAIESNYTLLRLDINKFPSKSDLRIVFKCYDNQILKLLIKVIRDCWTPNHMDVFKPSYMEDCAPNKKFYFLFAAYKKDYNEYYKIILRNINIDDKENQFKLNFDDKFDKLVRKYQVELEKICALDHCKMVKILNLKVAQQDIDTEKQKFKNILKLNEKDFKTLLNLNNIEFNNLLTISKYRSDLELFINENNKKSPQISEEIYDKRFLKATVEVCTNLEEKYSELLKLSNEKLNIFIKFKEKFSYFQYDSKEYENLLYINDADLNDLIKLKDNLFILNKVSDYMIKNSAKIEQAGKDCGLTMWENFQDKIDKNLLNLAIDEKDGILEINGFNELFKDF